MSKSKEIKALEAKLAAAKAKEKQEKGLTLFVKKENDFIEVEVKAKELNKFDKAEMFEATAEIGEVFDYLDLLNVDLPNETMGFWLKFIYLLDEPFQKLLGTAFDRKDEIIPSIPNIDAFIEIIQTNDEWLGESTKQIMDQLPAIKKYAEKNGI